MADDSPFPGLFTAHPFTTRKANCTVTMEDYEHNPRALVLVKEEIEQIKREINILKKRPDVLFREEWMDGQDVMLALNISPRTLRTLRLTGALPFTRLHKKIFYKAADIRSLLEQNYIRYHFTNHHDQ